MVNARTWATIMPKEFSELNSEYSKVKNTIDELNSQSSQIISIRKRLTKLLAEKESLNASKDEIDTLFSYLDEKKREEEKRSIDLRIRRIDYTISRLKENTLFKSKEEIEGAKNSVDTFLEQANSNPDFKKAVREEIIKHANNALELKGTEKDALDQKVNFINSLETTAETDQTLKDILTTINNLRQEYAVFSRRINSLPEDSKERKTLDSLLKNTHNELLAQVVSFDEYIKNNKNSLNIPSPNVKAEFASEFFDADNFSSLANIKDNAQRRANLLNKEMDALDNYKEYAKEDIENIASAIPPTNSKVTAIANVGKTPFKFLGHMGKFVKNFFHGVSNWLQNKPFKEAFEEKDVTPKEKDNENKIVDSTNNFNNIVETDLGRDAYTKVINEYRNRYSHVGQQAPSKPSNAKKVKIIKPKPKKTITPKKDDNDLSR